jgi:lysophospholipase L1-like esterase
MSINVKEKFDVSLSRWTGTFTNTTATQDKGTVKLVSTNNGSLYSSVYRLTGYGITGRDVSSVRILVVANSKTTNPSTIGVGFYEEQTVGGPGNFSMQGGMTLFQNDNQNIVFQNQKQGIDINQQATLGKYNIGDLFEIILTSDRTTYTTQVTNLTKGQSPVSVTAQVLQPHTTSTTERVYSNYGIFIANGSFNVLSFNVGGILEDAKYVFIGDSITKGFAAGPFSLSWAGILTTHTSNDILIEPGDAANTADGITITPEINTYPDVEYAFLMLGGNDPLFGISQPTSFSNYDTMAANLRSAGKRIVHLLLPPRSTAQEAWIVTFNTHIQSTYIGPTFPNDIIVDTYTPLKDPNSPGLNPIYQSDTLHPNALGHFVISETIRATLPGLFPS